MKEFSNNEIQAEHLPTAENIPFTPLEQQELKVRQINFAIFCLFVIGSFLAAFFMLNGTQKPWIFVGIATFMIGILTLSWLNLIFSFRWSGFALREQDLLYRSGWLRKRLRIVPLSRIQHLSIESGWLDRYFGLSSLKIYTAATADFSISGLKKEQAENMKAWINEQINLQVVKERGA